MANSQVIITDVTLSKETVNVNEKVIISVSIAELIPESILKRLAFKLGLKGAIKT